MKRFLGLAAMALSVFSAASLPGNADAVTCYANNALPLRTTLSGTTCWIYYRPLTSTGSSPALGSSYWMATVSTTTTTGAAMCEMATDAVTNQTRIYIGASSSLTACPLTTATVNVGTVTYLTVNP